MEELRNEIMSLIKQYATAQHTRRLAPHMPGATNGMTAGANNTYIIYGFLAFGTDAKTTGTGNAYIKFLLPDDYVAGTNFSIQLEWDCPNTNNPNIIDYQIKTYRATDNAAISLEDTASGTFSGADNGFRNFETITAVTGTNFNAGEGVELVIRMEDDDNNVNTYLRFIALDITVNGRD